MYRTLVADGGLPPGHDRRVREISNIEASGPPKQRYAQKEKRAKDAKTSADQFLLAAEMPPWRYKSHLQRSLHAGPAVRKDTEEKESTRWVEVLGAMLVHTPTPMGKILGDKPGSLQLLGAGRRASTLRSRVRAVRRYLSWLALDRDVGNPRELEHATGYLQARQSEPCTRKALRKAHTAIAFMEEVAGVEPTSKFTASQVYSTIQKEFFCQCASRETFEASAKDASGDVVDA